MLSSKLYENMKSQHRILSRRQYNIYLFAGGAELRGVLGARGCGGGAAGDEGVAPDGGDGAGGGGARGAGGAVPRVAPRHPAADGRQPRAPGPAPARVPARAPRPPAPLATCPGTSHIQMETKVYTVTRKAPTRASRHYANQPANPL